MALRVFTSRGEKSIPAKTCKLNSVSVSMAEPVGLVIPWSSNKCLMSCVVLELLLYLVSLQCLHIASKAIFGNEYS